VLRLLVFGGSQGARIMSDVVPAAIARLTAPERARLQIVQQMRQEDFARVRAAYAQAGVEAELAPFFRDLPFHMARSQLVIARAGASTVAEISVIGRPSILVPLPGSLDQDQAGNARSLADIGAATMLGQAQFEPDALADMLSQILFAPSRLAEMALLARQASIPDAAERLADLVAQTARLPSTPALSEFA
jgi:UDP-N-acetylglucosamine--N-acetylmuramyl-(pentapeptide) pyrophosphoryl-undecaprenol N-acetylglucosamine transferase